MCFQSLHVILNPSGKELDKVLNADGSKTVKFKSLSEHFADEASEKQKFLKFYESVHTRTVEKPFKATLSLAYEGKDKVKKDFKDEKTITVSYEEQFVGINYFIVFLALALLVGVGYSVFFGLQDIVRKFEKNSRRNFLKNHNPNFMHASWLLNPARLPRIAIVLVLTLSAVFCVFISRVFSDSSVIVTARVGAQPMAPIVTSVTPSGSPVVIARNSLQTFSLGVTTDPASTSLTYTITPSV